LVFWFLERYSPSETVKITRICYIHKEKIKFGPGFIQYMCISILTTVREKRKEKKRKKERKKENNISLEDPSLS
jgi:hypothetical protein